jgi:hypothetical protein
MSPSQSPPAKPFNMMLVLIPVALVAVILGVVFFALPPESVPFLYDLF